MVKIKTKSEFYSGRNLRAGNACCHLAQNLLSSSLLYKNIIINTYRTIIWPCCCVWVCNSGAHIEDCRLRLFEHRVLRKTFGPKRNEVTGVLQKLHNEELTALYSLPNIIRVIKSRIRWAGYLARLEVEERYTRFWWENLRENRGVDGSMTLR